MSTSFQTGDVIGGRFRLDRLLGRGGMGEVWAATHEVTEQRHALKVLKGDRDTAPLRKRFLREAKAASRVEHPNVISIQDVFALEDGAPVMVMDLLEGETLRALLEREESLSLEATAALVLPVLDATRAAHVEGIVHRDLKPENIFVVAGVTGPERMRVLDFGIAKLSEPGEGGTMTDEGQLLGTPLYMSPEQLVGDDIDAATDVWAIGVILYEMLTGGRPIEASHPGRMLKAILEEGHMPIASVLPDLPSEVAEIIERALSEEREERPSLEELAATLDRDGAASSHEDEPRGSRVWLGVAAAVVVSLGIGATQLGSDETSTARPAQTAHQTVSTSATSPIPAPVASTAKTIASPPQTASAATAPSPAPSPATRPIPPKPSVQPTATPYKGGVVEDLPD